MEKLEQQNAYLMKLLEGGVRAARGNHESASEDRDKIQDIVTDILKEKEEKKKQEEEKKKAEGEP